MDSCRRTLKIFAQSLKKNKKLQIEQSTNQQPTRGKKKKTIEEGKKIPSLSGCWALREGGRRGRGRGRWSRRRKKKGEVVVEKEEGEGKKVKNKTK